MSAALLRAPVEPCAAYAERSSCPADGLDAFAIGLAGRVRGILPRRWGSALSAVQQADTLADTSASYSDDALRHELRRRALQAVAEPSANGPAMPKALALVREAAARSLGMRPYSMQLYGASLLLAGRVAEMQTGEGKTLTAGLAAVMVALAGVPVHVLTVNDYLAERDANKLRPLMNFLGLSVGVVLSGMAPEDRQRAYACDITYVTGKEVAFDYLKDKVATSSVDGALQARLSRWVRGECGSPTLLRGLHFAIVDEADSIFIDEARTPLILSVQADPDGDGATYSQALNMARGLQLHRDFVLREASRELHLTDQGRESVSELCIDWGPAWQVRQAREHLAAQALRAMHLYHRDQQYIIKDNQVLIVDEQTGRAMPGRTWEAGLHQLIETKEGVPLSNQVRTVARITYQRFFRRYLRLSGMTGTAREVRHELWQVYRLLTVTVPTHKPGLRRVAIPLCLTTDAARWQAVCDSVQEHSAAGRPVLIGTRSVHASLQLAAALNERGIPYRLLNALHDAAEAALVESAGESGMVTVATNMAGRGTDIALGNGVRAAGGLHVILSEFHESRRVDRQLFGRAARQGDPGSAQAIVSLQDELLMHHGGWLRWLVSMLPPGRLQSLGLSLLRRRCQGATERQHARQRRAALRHDRQLETLLSFSGRN